MRVPVKSCIARTLPQCGAGDDRVADVERAALDEDVATGPRPGSRWDSITVPDAAASGFAFSSSSSATSRIMSSRLSRPSLVLAETSQKIGLAAPVLGLRP